MNSSNITSELKKTQESLSSALEFMKKTNAILEMIGVGKSASDVYNEIALMYESLHPGMRCSLLELEDGKLIHGGAPSMPKEYTEAINGLAFGPEIGSCGTSTYTGCRVLVKNIETDPKWKNIKQYAIPHGLRCCWSQPIIDSKGKVLGAFGMYYNYPALPSEEEEKDLLSAARLSSIVMERDQSHKLMQKNQRLLEEQSKLASMGEMFNNIAHQWRQPLSSLSVSATGVKLLKEKNSLSDTDFNNSMDNINEAVQFLSQTIEDFRGFLDPKNDRFKRVSALKLVEKTLKLVGAQLENKNIEIIQDIEDFSFESLENELIQVFLNLISNSKDAFNSQNNQKKLIFINTYIKENLVFFEFIDNAGGISDDIIFRVFQSYFTTKYKNNGTGIGLYMSKDIINRLLKGKIKVENTTFSYLNHKYKGAKFTIEIPLA